MLVDLFDFSRLIIVMRCFSGIFCSLGFLCDFSCVAFLVWQGSFLCFDALYEASQTRLFWYFSCLIELCFLAVAVFFREFYVVAKKRTNAVCSLWTVLSFKALSGRARSNLWFRRFGYSRLVRLTSQSTTITTQPITVLFFIFLATLHMLILLWVVTCYLCC